MNAVIFKSTSRALTTSRPYRKKEIREVRGCSFPLVFRNLAARYPRGSARTARLGRGGSPC